MESADDPNYPQLANVVSLHRSRQIWTFARFIFSFSTFVTVCPFAPVQCLITSSERLEGALRATVAFRQTIVLKPQQGSS